MADPNLPLNSSTFEMYRPVEMFVARSALKRRYWLHVLLLLLTIFTTLVVGARLQYNFDQNLPAFSIEDSIFPVRWAIGHPSHLLLGIPFSATLLLILLAHEMGHFLYCVRYGVWATLPFFIPAPTLIGTFGAFIRIRSPIRSRSALFDIGIAGPIAGFVVGVLVLAIALALSKPMAYSAAGSDIQFGYPLIFHVVQRTLAVVLPAASHVNLSFREVSLHPVAIAAWVGMFATALNLLPGGQLDGGHIVYAVSPRIHRRVSRITVVLLVIMTGLWLGWLLWSVLLMVTGMRHPQVSVEPGLSPRRKLLAIGALIMFALTFIPAPFGGAGVISFWR
jgi:membrane-associated protease RseP (regulator of RpoE activity)